MQSRVNTIKDRNGVDTGLGDMVFFLQGSPAGEGHYETCGEVIEVMFRERMVKVDTGDYLRWFEFWQEE